MSKELKIRLKDQMKRRGIKTPALAEMLNIPKDRIYAWYRDDTNPKGDDARKIQNWLDGEENGENFNSESKVSLDDIAHALQRILEEQVLARADVRAFGEYQVMKDAKGDPAVREEIMAQINRLVGVNLGELRKRGNLAGSGRRDMVIP